MTLGISGNNHKPFVSFFLLKFSLPFILLSGCTNYLKVDPIFRETSEPTEGVLYYLPKKEFEIELTRQIKTCGREEIEIIQTSLVTDKNLTDFSEAYLVKYRELDSKTKKIDLALELYSNGTLKSMNGIMTDKSGEIIENSVSGAIRIARTALLPASAVLSAPDSLEELCEMQVRSALARLKTLNEQKKDKEKELADKKKEIENLPANQQDTHKKILKNLEESLRTIQEDMTNDLKLTIKKQVYTFRPNRNLLKKRLDPNPNMINEWFNIEKLNDLCTKEPDSCYVAQKEDGNTFNVPLSTIAFIEVYMPSPPPILATQTSQGSFKHPKNQAIKDWLIYRQPVEGLIMICSLKSCLSKTGEILAERSIRVFEKKYLLPQLGVKLYLPLINGAFEDKTLKAEFSEEGALTKFNYTTNASGVEASAAFKNSVESAAKMAEEKRKASEDAVNQETKRLESERKKIEEQILLIQKQRELQNIMQNE